MPREKESPEVGDHWDDERKHRFIIRAAALTPSRDPHCLILFTDDVLMTDTVIPATGLAHSTWEATSPHRCSNLMEY